MGQRHQLFVIASINGRYRSLAAVHHQWLFGQTALRTCGRLAYIFQDPHNRRLLELEIANAEKLPDEDWKRPLDWNNTTPQFPFVTTCLVLGASVGFPIGNTSNAIPEPWHMDFDGGDNNDGVTILDISQPALVRYCFVIFLDDYNYEDEDESEDEAPDKCMTPLRGADYLSTYYKEKEWTSEMKGAVGSLDKFPLIHILSLNEAWPRRDWKSRAERGFLDPPTDDEPAGIDNKSSIQSLTSISMEKSIERILNEEDELLQDVEELPSFQPSLKDYLYKHPSVVAGRRFGFAMLQKALKGGQGLDLHPFPQLSVEQVIQLVDGAGDPKTLDMLDISGNGNITVNGISEILAKASVQQLYTWDNPKLPYMDLMPFVRAGRVKDLLHRGLFAAPFGGYENQREKLIDRRFQDTTPSANASIPISSFRQLIWIHSPGRKYDGGVPKKTADSKLFDAETRASLKGTQLDGFGSVFSLAIVSLDEISLDPPELLSSLTRLMQCMAMTRFYGFGFGSGERMAFPFGLAMHNPESPWAISSIPTKPYMQARAAYHSSAVEIPKTMHPLAPGEWTVLVLQEQFDIEERKGAKMALTDRFRMAFLTHNEGGKMRLLDAKTFMEETNSGDFAGRWEKAISELKSQEERDSEEEEQPLRAVEVIGCDEETVDNIMALMEMIEREEIK